MENLKRLCDGFVLGFCKASELDKKDIVKRIHRFEYGKKTNKYLHGAMTVIVVGSIVELNQDIYCRGITKCIVGDDYPAYKEANLQAKRIKNFLKEEGYGAEIASGINFKYAAVLSGLGSWGKNSLVINKKYGTKLRFAALVTNWIPEKYDVPIGINFCNNCNLCIEACPYDCLKDFEVDAKKCFCKYIKKGQFSLEIPMCDICQKVCPYNFS
ncbi:MAG: hypothetical protein ACI4LO_03195 [Anaerovoracaceae bacterium]